MNQQTFDKIRDSIEKTKGYVHKTEKDLKLALKMQSKAGKAQVYTIIVLLCAIGGIALVIFLASRHSK